MSRLNFISVICYREPANPLSFRPDFCWKHNIVSDALFTSYLPSGQEVSLNIKHLCIYLIPRTCPDLQNNYFVKGLIENTYLFTHGHIREVSLNSNSNTLELDRPQRDLPAACVIAQQQSSPTFVLLRFHFRTKKFDVFYKNVNLFFFIKLCKFESV